MVGITAARMSLQSYVNSKLSDIFHRHKLYMDISLTTGLVEERVVVITTDGRTLTGLLLSCDQLTNLVLGQTIERVIRPSDDPEPSAEVPHGLYLIRGENVAICGLLEEDLDATIDWTNVRGNIIGGVKHI